MHAVYSFKYYTLTSRKHYLCEDIKSRYSAARENVLTFSQFWYLIKRTTNSTGIRANWINCLLYKVLLNLHIFPVLNKNCTEPYPVRYIEGIFNNYSSSPNGLSASWAMDSEAMSSMKIVGQKYGEKTTLASETRFSCHCFCFQSRRFSLLVGYNMPISSSTNQNAELITDN